MTITDSFLQSVFLQRSGHASPTLCIKHMTSLSVDRVEGVIFSRLSLPIASVDWQKRLRPWLEQLRVRTTRGRRLARNASYWHGLKRSLFLVNGCQKFLVKILNLNPFHSLGLNYLVSFFSINRTTTFQPFRDWPVWLICKWSKLLSVKDIFNKFTLSTTYIVIQ